VSNLRRRSVSGELSSELESSGSSCENSRLHWREARAVTGRPPILAEGSFPMPADGPGMFLLCVYPLAERKGLSIPPGDGWEEVELALANAEPEYFQAMACAHKRGNQSGQIGPRWDSWNYARSWIIVSARLEESVAHPMVSITPHTGNDRQKLLIETFTLFFRPA
jgi:hypothetical protein